MKLNEELIKLYERWLVEEYPDEIHNTDDLIEKSEKGLHWEKFEEEVLEELK